MSFNAIFDAFLSLIFPQRCVVCRRIGSDVFCRECLGKINYCDNAHIIGIYDGVLRSAICAFKFKKKKNLAEPLAKLFLPKIKEKFDAIVYPPLNNNKKRKRGFDHMELLADEINSLTSIPVRHDILLRQRDTLPQFGLTKDQRYMNVSGAFSLKGNAPDIKGKNILLIDDILTTGATMQECEICLKNAGVFKIFKLALAHGNFLEKS